MPDEFDQLFAEESFNGASPDGLVLRERFWKVLILDDADDIHFVTKIALEGFEFEKRSLCFISAKSAAEAKLLAESNPDLALAFVDVVLETDTAGLEFVRYVREVLNNHLLRIVLRTGQPGQAPERDVILKYDINDYKEKTELTSDRLFTTVLSSLRTYRDMLAIEHSQAGLRKILDSSISIFSQSNIDVMMEESERSLKEICEKLAVYSQMSIECFLVKFDDEVFVPVARQSAIIISDFLLDALQRSLSSCKKISEGGLFCSPFITKNHKIFLCLEADSEIPELYLDMINFFCGGILVALKNAELHDEIYGLNQNLEHRIALQTAELINKNSELEVVVRQKQNLVRILYHDLSNSLAVILGAANVGLRAEGFSRDKNQLMWEKVQKSADIQKELIEQIRNLDSVSSGKRQLEIKPANLNAVISKSLFLFRDKLIQKSVTVDVQLEDSNMIVYVEPSSFSNSVINNLISNAIKFSYSDSKICIKAVRINKEIVLLTCSDYGIGIPPEILKDIFREDKKTSRSGTLGEVGTGFGMPLVKTYMDLYQSRIEIKSTSEQQDSQAHGTTVYLYLKACP